MGHRNCVPNPMIVSQNARFLQKWDVSLRTINPFPLADAFWRSRLLWQNVLFLNYRDVTYIQEGVFEVVCCTFGVGSKMWNSSTFTLIACFLVPCVFIETMYAMKKIKAMDLRTCVLFIYYLTHVTQDGFHCFTVYIFTYTILCCCCHFQQRSTKNL